MNQFPFVAVQGSPYDRGRQYGLTAESRIRKSVAFYAAQLERLGLVGNRRQEIIAGSIEEIAKFEPTYIDEMRGIADGAGLALDDIVIVNARTEIVSAARRLAGRNVDPENDVDADGCTGAVILPSRSLNGNLIQGQNWDWNPACVETAIVLKIERDEGPTVLTFVEAGGLGRHGLNSAGIGVTGNYLQSDRDYKTKGVPLSLVRRKALDQKHVAIAMSYIATTPKVCSTNMIVTAAEGWAVDYECAPDESFPIFPEKDLIVHANHWISSIALGKLKDAGLTGSADSQYRDWRVRKLLEAAGDRLTRDHLKSALFDTFLYPNSVCRPEEREGREISASVAMIVMEPGNGIMEVAPAPYKNKVFTRYSITSDPEIVN